MNKTPKKPLRSVRKPSRLPQIKPSRKKQVDPKRKVQEEGPVTPETPAAPKREKIERPKDPSRRRQYMLDRRKEGQLVHIRVTPGDGGAESVPVSIQVIGAVGPAKKVARELGGQLSNIGAGSVVTSTTMLSGQNARGTFRVTPNRAGRLGKLGKAYRIPNGASRSTKGKVHGLPKVSPFSKVRIEMRLEAFDASEVDSIRSIIEDRT